MRTESIIVDNLKCGGCANTISKNIKALDGVNDIQIELEKSELTIECEDALDRETLLNKLSKLGYPEQGTSNFVQKATSYVSCMVGRMSDKEA
ncbi:MAG: heavy-metal-associated domain-containing protein [Bacteroidetes bacterium]|nr:heavy-metal-associated domain-containing protein [Bacteroidota bacterium]